MANAKRGWINFIRKLAMWLGGFVAGLALLLVLLYLFTPEGKDLWHGIRTGLIFHPEAYRGAFLPSGHEHPLLQHIRLPHGFRIEVYADQIENARSLARSDRGTIFVGTRTHDKVFALRDSDGDHSAEELLVVAEGLNMPNGVAFRDGSLYVAEMDRILRFDRIDDTLPNPPAPQVVYDGFPRERRHGWKFIAFGPDGKLYVPVGAPCNICDRGDPFATITRLNTDGSGFEIFARGVRNTVGFDWHPETGELWFTDNGRDWLGDDRPPDELNHAPVPGLHFGFPYCHGRAIPDPDYGRGDCEEYRKPERELGPHVAALGMRFYTGTMFPEMYRGSIFIAEHGSWNRTVPIGYRIMRVGFAKGQRPTYEVFAEGWRHAGEVWGRPVDLLVLPDGSMLVSDDKAGAIYRISYDPGR